LIDLAGQLQPDGSRFNKNGWRAVGMLRENCRALKLQKRKMTGENRMDKQESRAVASKPRDAGVVLLGL